MYGYAPWGAMEMPASSRRYDIVPIPNIMCSASSPIPCPSSDIGQGILSMGEDNSKDTILLATDAVYRVVAPGLCDGGAPQPQQSSDHSLLHWLLSLLGLCALAFAVYALNWIMFPSSGEQTAVPHCGHNTCCNCNNIQMTPRNSTAENHAQAADDGSSQ